MPCEWIVWGGPILFAKTFVELLSFRFNSFKISPRFFGPDPIFESSGNFIFVVFSKHSTQSDQICVEKESQQFD